MGLLGLIAFQIPTPLLSIVDSTSRNMDVACIMLVFLVSLVWDWRMVLFKLSGFYCARTPASTPRRPLERPPTSGDSKTTQTSASYMLLLWPKTREDSRDLVCRIFMFMRADGPQACPPTCPSKEEALFLEIPSAGCWGNSALFRKATIDLQRSNTSTQPFHSKNHSTHSSLKTRLF